jgi:hypothetical protein
MKLKWVFEVPRNVGEDEALQEVWAAEVDSAADVLHQVLS